MKKILLTLTLISLLLGCRETQPNPNPPVSNNDLAKEVIKKYYLLGIERGYLENNNPLSKQELEKLQQTDLSSLFEREINN